MSEHNIISVSGEKDSTALLLLAIERQPENQEKAEALAKAEMETWAKALPMIAEEVDAIKKTRESIA